MEASSSKQLAIEISASRATPLVNVSPQIGIPSTLSVADQRKYLGSTQYFPAADSLIASTTRALIEGAKSDFERAQRIHDFVANHIKYPDESDKRMDAVSQLCMMQVSNPSYKSTIPSFPFCPISSAETSFKSGLGNCINFAGLTVTMMRSAHIPARLIQMTPEGIAAAQKKMGEEVHHYWVQVFVDGRWIDMDPTFDASAPISHNFFVFSKNNLAADDVIHRYYSIYEDDSSGFGQTDPDSNSAKVINSRVQAKAILPSGSREENHNGDSVESAK